MNDETPPDSSPDAYIGDALETVEPELTDDELTLRSWRDSLLHGSSVLTMPPRRWIVESWLPHDALVAVYAEPGIGKSFYAVTLALELARGVRWIEKLKRAHRVLYVAAEKPNDIRDRVEAWSIANGCEIPSGFMLMPKRPDISLTGHTEMLTQLIEEHRVDVVILDTYAAVTAGIDENSSQDTGRVMKHLDRIREATRGGSVIAVHHAGKDKSRKLRGSTAFLGACDLTVVLDQPETGVVRASVDKSNAGRDGMSEHYRIDPVQLPAPPGEIYSRSVPRLIHTGTPVLKGSTEEIILEVLQGFGAPASRSAIQEELREIGKPLETAQLNRYLRKMRDAKQITVHGKENRPTYAPATGGSILPIGDDE